MQPFRMLGGECAEQLGQGVPHAFSMKCVFCLYCIAKLCQGSRVYVSDIGQDGPLPAWSSAIRKNSLKGGTATGQPANTGTAPQMGALLRQHQLNHTDLRICV